MKQEWERFSLGKRSQLEAYMLQGGVGHAFWGLKEWLEQRFA